MTGFSELSASEQVERFRELALTAVLRWPLEVVGVEPIKVRENAVFVVHLANGGKHLLRRKIRPYPQIGKPRARRRDRAGGHDDNFRPARM